MRIVVAPAKKMRVDTDSFPVEGTPLFIDDAERIKAALQAMAAPELQRLWGCGDALARLNVERLRDMDLRRDPTPALISYDGTQYRYMAPEVFEDAQVDYVREHLRILSGFYGLLRPFDGVVPYRLEMHARLAVGGARDLYEFWGGRLARRLASESDLVVNLASKEYSRAVEPFLPSSTACVTCTFGELEGGRVRGGGTMCKMARGEMVRWLAENDVTDREGLRGFDRLGYSFRAELSSEAELVFAKAPAR